MSFVPLDNQCRTSKSLQTGTSLDDLVNGIFFCSKVEILILIFTVPAGLVTVMLNPTPKQNLNLLYMVLKLIV